MSTENATKWSLKGKTFHPWSLGRVRKSLETGEDMTNICDVTPAFVGWLLEIGVFFRELAADTPCLRDRVWPPRCGKEGVKFTFEGFRLKRQGAEAERRKWPRLPLAIPIFVRSRDDDGKESLEFATALNISAGGTLVAVRRSLPLSAQVLLEIPSAPLVSGNSFPKAARVLRARTVRVTHVDGYHLLGLKFSQPLVNGKSERRSSRRKVASPV